MEKGFNKIEAMSVAQAADYWSPTQPLFNMYCGFAGLKMLFSGSVGCPLALPMSRIRPSAPSWSRQSDPCFKCSSAGKSAALILSRQ
jgi:hypothetical protein